MIIYESIPLLFHKQLSNMVWYLLHGLNIPTYDLLLQESYVSPFVAAHLSVSLSCPQVFICVLTLPSCNHPSTFTSVIDNP